MNEKTVEPRYIPSIHLVARNRRPMIEQGTPMSRENALAWIDQMIRDRTDRVGFIHRLGSNS